MFSGKLTHQSKNQSSVARIAMGKETELLESIDKAITRMVSEYPSRNESERAGSFEKFRSGSRILQFWVKTVDVF